MDIQDKEILKAIGNYDYNRNYLDNPVKIPTVYIGIYICYDIKWFIESTKLAR